MLLSTDPAPHSYLLDSGVCSCQKHGVPIPDAWAHSTEGTMDPLYRCMYCTDNWLTILLHCRLWQNSLWFKRAQDFSHRLIGGIGSLFPAGSPSWAPGFPVPLWRKLSLTEESLMLHFITLWGFKTNLMWRSFSGSSFCQDLSLFTEQLVKITVLSGVN